MSNIFSSIGDYVKKYSKGTPFEQYGQDGNPLSSSSKTQQLISKLAANDYDIDKLMYPLDIESAENNNYMVFYINENTKNKSGGKFTTVKRISVDDLSFSPTLDVFKNEKDKEKAKRQKTDFNGIDTTKRVKRSTKGVRPNTEQLRKAIVLYVPDNLQISVSHGWNAEGTRSAAWSANILKGLMNAGKSLASLDISGMGQALSKTFTGARGDAEYYAKAKLLGSGANALMDSNASSIFNPAIAFVYKQPEPREFTYTFKFSPRNIEELVAVYNIIKAFKYHSHGNFVGSDILFPAEFMVEFYSGPNENKWMYKTKPMGLTNLSLNLTGTDSILSFLNEIGDTGAPPQSLILNLNFSELHIPSRQDVAQGY